jgi:hypothetical protein
MTTWGYAEIQQLGDKVWWLGIDGEERLDSDLVEQLNAAGAEGWELAGVTESVDRPGGDRLTRYTFKRPIESDPA